MEGDLDNKYFTIKFDHKMKLKDYHFMYDKINYCLTFKKDLEFSDLRRIIYNLQAKSILSEAILEAKIAQAQKYFSKQKNFAFSIEKTINIRDSHIAFELPNANEIDPQEKIVFHETLNLNLEKLYYTIYNDPRLEKRDVIRRLYNHINQLEFPEKFTRNKKLIIVGYIAASLGYYKTEREFNDADYNQYLSGCIKDFLKIKKNIG